MAYPTLNELIEASAVEELASMAEPDQSALRAAAISSIERYTRQSFEPVDLVLPLSGAGNDVLYLPRRVVELTDASIAGSALTLSDVVVADPERDRLTLKSYGANYYERAMRDIQGIRDSRWPVGTGNIVLSGTFGWEDVPEDVVVAIRYEMEDTARADANVLAGTIAAMRKLGLKTLNQGGISLTAGSVVPISPRAAALLEDYVWLGSVGELV